MNDDAIKVNCEKHGITNLFSCDEQLLQKRAKEAAKKSRLGKVRIVERKGMSLYLYFSLFFRTIVLLIMGLDNSGKSTILNHISGGKFLKN